ncbi:MAG: Ada3 domain-containing protein [Asgard group archaeon]|nr:Ada3 domain-containing protein [Asgard group archaeon]
MSDVPLVSTTLDDIVTELKLSYDSSVGLLEGDAIRAIPNINTLTNLNKLLKNLWKQLNDVEGIDDDVLKRIEILKEKQKKDDNAADTKDKINDKKRTADEMEADTLEAPKIETDKEFNKEESAKDEYEDEDDDVPINIAKKRKLNSDVSSDKSELLQESSEIKLKSEESTSEVKREGEQEEKERLNSKDDPIPPVQSGNFTQDNDTRLKNPKSEYVEPQTLSASAIAELGLFSEDNNGLETQGKDYLKKKYGVASYPERDLQELLPGEIPDIDFSKNKPPTNQVQFTTFQSYIESYFRHYLNEDLKFLNERNVIPPGFEKQGYDPDLTPFVIPKLGRFYADVWTEEDSTLSSKLNTPGYQQSPSDSYLAKGSIDDLTEDRLYTEDISCGPLSNRLLSAILSTREGGISDDEDELSKDSTLKTEVKDENKPSIISEDEVATQLNSEEDYKVVTEANDFQSVEERLKRELKYIGIFMNLPTGEEGKPKAKQTGGRASKKSTVSIIDNDEWIKNKEDDEVCAEIRKLQKQLKEVTSRNRANRKKLIPLVEEHIAYQEYCAILEDLDKQVDLSYMKRLKGKGKKRKTDANTPQQQAINSGLRALLEKRKRWIDNIGKLFPVAEKMKRIPSESILIKDGTVEAEQNDEDNAETGTSAVDILTQKSM